MTYVTLIEGAKGLLWYTYKGYGQYLPVDDPELWQFHIELLREINTLAPLFMEYGLGKSVSLIEKNENIRGSYKSSKIGTFVIAANQSKTDTYMTDFQLESKITGQMSVYGENRMIPIENGRFRDEFKPLDVHIYKLPD
jgi:hypothetical protein